MKSKLLRLSRHQAVWRLALSVGGGLLSSVAFPRESISPLIFVAVCMMLLSVNKLKTSSAFLIGLPGGLSFYLSQIEWLTLYLGPVPWLALSTLEALIFATGMAAVAFVWNFLRATISNDSWFKSLLIAFAIAVIWAAREWVSITLPYGGFPWARLAQTQSETFLSKWVYWGGLGWLTLVLAFISAAMAIWASGGFARKWRPDAPVALALIVSFTVPLFTVIDAGPQAGSISIGAVQGNANAGLFSNSERGSILNNHLQASQLLGDAKVDVVVWPENASDVNVYSDPIARARIRDFVDNKIGVPLIFGTITSRGDEIFNSSILWEPEVGPTDWYDKKRPVPFAEYVPDRDFWYQLAPDLVGLVSRGYAFGEREGIFEIGNANLGALICFEIAIDDIGRDLVADGAQVILSQTNNADFGRSDQTFQQAAFARLRAIETGRTVVNVSTVGVSAIYNADGSVVQQLETFAPGVMVQEIPLRDSITPAMLLGRWVELGINLFAVILILGATRFSFRFRRRHL